MRITIKSLRKTTDQADCTPLDRLEEDKLVRWHDRNRLAIAQSQQGESRSLNDSAVLDRLRKRLAEEGILS